MSEYTSELRFICETEVGLVESVGYNSTKEVIRQAIPKIFNFDFPIFDENYRNVLLTKIIKHYYTREIGEESYGLWKLRLDTKMNEIMPYYNKLYLSELIKYNPLYTTELETTRNNKGINDSKHGNTLKKEKDTTDTLSHGTTTKHTNDIIETHSDVSNDVNHDAYSDTPQGSLSNVESNTYLTNYRKTDGSNTNSGTTETNTRDDTTRITGNDITSHTGTDTDTTDGWNYGTTTEDYLEKTVGYNGVDPSERILKYRETFLNIDMLIINELEPLFFQLW